jgi:hypothetical protein
VRKPGAEIAKLTEAGLLRRWCCGWRGGEAPRDPDNLRNTLLLPTRRGPDPGFS